MSRKLPEPHVFRLQLELASWATSSRSLQCVVTTFCSPPVQPIYDKCVALGGVACGNSSGGVDNFTAKDLPFAKLTATFHLLRRITAAMPMISRVPHRLAVWHFRVAEVIALISQ